MMMLQTRHVRECRRGQTANTAAATRTKTEGGGKRPRSLPVVTECHVIMLMMDASNGGGGVTYLMENVAVIMRSNERKEKKKEKGKDEASWEEKQN